MRRWVAASQRLLARWALLIRMPASAAAPSAASHDRSKLCGDDTAVGQAQG
jgi:hypothetical protein